MEALLAWNDIFLCVRKKGFLNTKKPSLGKGRLVKNGLSVIRQLLGRLNNSSVLTNAIAEVVQLGTTYLAASDDLNLGDTGGVQGERAFYAFAIGNLANRERFVETGATLADHKTLEDLDTFLTAFDNTAVNLDVVSYIKGCDIGLELFLFDFVDDVHLAVFRVKI